MKSFTWRRLLNLLAMTVLYYVTGRLGLDLASVNPSTSAVWAPTGIAIAAFLLAGPEVWPAILLGAFLVNYSTDHSITAALAIGGGNTLEGMAGAALTQRFANGRQAFSRAVDVFKFALFAGGVATMISASTGVLTLLTHHMAIWRELPAIWGTWWLGDCCGALVVTPVLVLAAERPFLRWTRIQLVNAVLILSGFVLVGVVAFTPISPVGMYDYPLFLVVVPLVLAAAFRLRRLETAVAILVLAVMAVWGTQMAWGPFARYEPNTALLLLQVFMALTTMIGLVVAAEVSDRRRAEAALREREQLYHLVIESASDAIVTIDENSVITYANCAVEPLFGYSRQELVGQSITQLIPEHSRMEHLPGLLRNLTSGRRSASWQGREVQGRHKNGRTIPLEVSYGEHHTSRRLFTGVIRDISERQRALAAQRWMATIVANSNDAVIGKDLDGVVLSWNQSAERLFGYTAEEMLGRSVSLLYPADRQDEHHSIMGRIRRGETIGHFETERLRKDGTRVHISMTISPIDDGTGQLIGASSAARDITEQKQAEARIQHLAHHDALTGLANRLYFREHLAKEVAAAKKENRRVAVLFIDLDHFKEINDLHGHDIGDQLLQTVAQRLSHGLRTGDLVARLGGDEFVIVLGNRPTLEDAENIASKLLTRLREPIIVCDQEMGISASMGIGLFPDDGADAGTLLRSADQAMYRAKKNGRNHCEIRPEHTASQAQPAAPSAGLPQPDGVKQKRKSTSDSDRRRPGGFDPQLTPPGPHTPRRTRPTPVATDDIRFE